MKSWRKWLAAIVIVSIAAAASRNGYQYLTLELRETIDWNGVIDIDLDEQPMVWDFMMGTNGWHTDMDMTKYSLDRSGSYDDYFVFLWDDTKPDEFFVSFCKRLYTTYPSIGTRPKLFRMDEKTRTVLLDYMQSNPSDAYREKTFHVVVIPESNVPVKLAYVQADEEVRRSGSNFYRVLRQTRHGYPTEWLRKPEWVEYLKNKDYINSSELDILDPWWDEHEVMERRLYRTLTGVKCVVQTRNIDEFSVQFLPNMDGSYEEPKFLTAEKLEEFLSNRGYRESYADIERYLDLL